MGKQNNTGQAAILTKEDYEALKNNLRSARDRLIVTIGYFTGERISAILQLRIDSLYIDPKRSLPRERIFFPARTRKGKKDSRSFPIHPALREALQNFQPPSSGELMFPSKLPSRAIGFSTFDKAMRRALSRCRLADRGFSTHSFRRTFITRLHKGKVPIATIRAMTRHRSLQSLSGYIEISDDEISEALGTL